MKKNALQQFIEDRTHFDMPRGAKMSLALPELKVTLNSISNTTSGHPPQVERNYGYMMQNNQRKIIRDYLPMESPIELRMTLSSVI